MAHFEQHCLDCERILGKRHENVNHWMDELFRKKGFNHRRFRHQKHGVMEARELFGIEGAKAAIVHIVRDMGHVPRERDYDIVPEGIEVVPAFVGPVLGYGQWYNEFKKMANSEIRRLLG